MSASGSSYGAQQEPLLTPPFIEKLVEVMVLPTAGDAEILRSGADVTEAVLVEDTLQRNVVRQSSCLNTVQPQVLEAQACGRGNGGSSDPTPVHLLGNPVAEVGGVESSSDDVVDVDTANDAVVRQNDAWQGLATAATDSRLSELSPLVIFGKEGVVAFRFPRREEGPVRPVQLQKHLGVVRRNLPQLNVHDVEP